MTRQAALRWLLVEWLVGSSLIAGLLMVEVLAGKHGDSPGPIWGWVSTNLAPTLSLLITANLAAPNPTWGIAPAGRFMLTLTLGGSALYLLASLMLLLAEPLIGLTLGQVLDLASFPMSIWQGIVVAVISALLFDGR